MSSQAQGGSHSLHQLKNDAPVNCLGIGRTGTCRDTDEQGHRRTGTEKNRGTDEQGQRRAGTEKNRDREEQGHRRTGTEKNRGTDQQGQRRTGTPKNRDTEGKRGDRREGRG
jgi:hypothetical protein